MKSSSIAILALIVCSFFLNVSPVFSQKHKNNSELFDKSKKEKEKEKEKVKEKGSKKQDKTDPEPEMLVRIDQLTLKVESINAFIRSTQTAATELQSKEKELEVKKAEIARLQSEAKSSKEEHEKEINKLTNENATLSKEKEALEKRVISPAFCNAIMRNNAVMDELSLETLIASAADQTTKADLKEFQNNSKIISAAETFLRDGSNRGSYGNIYKAITALKVDTKKFPEQGKVLDATLKKINYYHSLLEQFNDLIVEINQVQGDARSFKIIRWGGYDIIQSLNWLADLCKKNMEQHVDLGIKF